MCNELLHKRIHYLYEKLIIYKVIMFYLSTMEPICFSKEIFIMQEQYNSIFTPWKIGNLEIKKRIVMAPMGGTCIFGWTEPNHFDKEAAKLLKLVADNNCGLIIPGVAPIRDIIGEAWLYQRKSKFKQ